MAVPVAGNAVSTSDTAGLVDFGALRGSVSVTNTGSTDPIYVRIWMGDEVPVATTTSLAGAMAVWPGVTITLNFDPRWQSGGGYKALGYVMASTKTSTMDYRAI